MELVRMSWGDLIAAVRSMARQLRGRDFDAVVAVGVSGLIPAVILRELLGVGEFYVMIVKRYSDDKPPRLLAEDPVVLQAPEPSSIKGKRVLVVDDLVRTGRTLEAVKRHLLSRGAASVTTAVVVRRGRSEVDVVGVEVSGCVLFPWEALSPVEADHHSPTCKPHHGR